MTHDDVHAAITSRGVAEGWRWTWAQTPQIQEMVLRVIIAMEAFREGWNGDDAWDYALLLVPETSPATPFFPGVDPRAEWLTVLRVMNDMDGHAMWTAGVSQFRDLVAGRVGYCAAFLGHAGGRAEGIGYEDDLSPTILATARAPTVIYDVR